MPIIRGPRPPAMDKQKRNSLVKQLINERKGPPQENGPLIFEIPLSQSDLFDVLVVWEAFHDVGFEDRTNLILDAYADQKNKISQAMGVTVPEAIEQSLLPYSVDFHKGNKDQKLRVKARDAMVAEGAFEINGQVELRFPAKEMAIDAVARLQEKVPELKWGWGW